MIDIYIINLKKRIDRLDKIKENLKNYNLHIIEAIEDKEGWIGCFKSHLKCIQIAKKLKLKYIIVIEDDCEIVSKESFNNNLILILEYLNKNINNWNIFLGGVTGVWEFNNLIKLSDDLNLININSGKTFHFCIYNSNCYDFFLNQKINIPIDKCWHNKLICVLSIPFIAIQYSNYSDIENKIVNYDSRFNNIEKYIIKELNKQK